MNSSPVTEISLHSIQNELSWPKASLELVQSHADKIFDVLSKKGLSGCQLQIGWADESLSRGLREEEIVILIPEDGWARLNSKALHKKLRRVCGGLKVNLQRLAVSEEILDPGQETSSLTNTSTGSAAQSESKVEDSDGNEGHRWSNSETTTSAAQKKRRSLWFPLTFQAPVCGEHEGTEATDTYKIFLKLLIEFSSNHEGNDRPPTGQGGPWAMVRVVKALISAPTSHLPNAKAEVKHVAFSISMNTAQLIDFGPRKRDSFPDPMYIYVAEELSTRATPVASAKIGSTTITTNMQSAHRWNISPKVGLDLNTRMMRTKMHYTVNPYYRSPPPNSEDFSDAATAFFGYKTQETTRELIVTVDAIWSVGSVPCAGTSKIGSRRIPLVANIRHHASVKIVFKAWDLPDNTPKDGSVAPLVLSDTVKLGIGESKELEPTFFELNNDGPVVLGGSIRMEPGAKSGNFFEKLKKSVAGLKGIFGSSSLSVPGNARA